jgi:hypothetical protein
MRRTLVAVAAAAGLVVAGAASTPAQAAPKPKPIVLATSTPAIDAAGGQAAFTATGLPKGTPYLLLLDPASKKWVRKATLTRSGTSGSATVTGVPQGVPQFRVQVGKRLSNVVAVKAYGIYAFGGYTKQHTYGSATMASIEGYFPGYKNLKVPDGFGCERVDVGLEMGSPQPTWKANVLVTSSSGVIDTVITLIPSEIKVASSVGKPVSGPIDIGINSSTSNSQPFFGWTGLQFHCLADPGISTIQ